MYSRRFNSYVDPIQMSLVKSNNQLTKSTVNSIINNAIATAASMYNINPTLATNVAKAAGSMVKAGLNSASNYISSRRTKSSNSPTIIVNNPVRGGRRGASRNRNAPIAVGSASRSSRWNNNYRLRNIERVYDMNTTGGIISIPINPGLSQSFPWLSNIAKSYDKYLFHRLTFRYKPTCPSTEPGQVVLAWDYDSLDPIPSDNQEMAQESYWVSVAPWQSSSFNISLAGIGRLYTRSSLIAGSDLKTYDLGQLLISSPATSTSSIGYVEVEYDITLYNKQPDFINSAPRVNTSLYNSLGNSASATVAANTVQGILYSNFGDFFASNTSYEQAAVQLSTAITTYVFNLPRAYYRYQISGTKLSLFKIVGGSGTSTDPYQINTTPVLDASNIGVPFIREFDGLYVIAYNNTTASSATCSYNYSFFEVM